MTEPKALPSNLKELELELAESVQGLSADDLKAKIKSAKQEFKQSLKRLQSQGSEGARSELKVLKKLTDSKLEVLRGELHARDGLNLSVGREAVPLKIQATLSKPEEELLKKLGVRGASRKDLTWEEILTARKLARKHLLEVTREPEFIKTPRGAVRVWKMKEFKPVEGALRAVHDRSFDVKRRARLQSANSLPREARQDLKRLDSNTRKNLTVEAELSKRETRVLNSFLRQVREGNFTKDGFNQPRVRTEALPESKTVSFKAALQKPSAVKFENVEREGVSVKDIAKDAGLSVHAVKTALNDLKKKGFLNAAESMRVPGEWRVYTNKRGRLERFFIPKKGHTTWQSHHKGIARKNAGTFFPREVVDELRVEKDLLESRNPGLKGIEFISKRRRAQANTSWSRVTKTQLVHDALKFAIGLGADHWRLKKKGAGSLPPKYPVLKPVEPPQNTVERLCQRFAREHEKVMHAWTSKTAQKRLEGKIRKSQRLHGTPMHRRRK